LAKIFIGALNIFSVLALVIFLKKCSDRERNQLRLESYCFRSGKIKRAHRFLFLTDVHEKEFGEKNEELLRRIRALRPDFILLGGDLSLPRRGGAGADGGGTGVSAAVGGKLSGHGADVSGRRGIGQTEAV